MTSNEMIARDKKATKLAAFLFSVGATSEHILSATEEDWKWVAIEASRFHGEKVNPPNKDNPKPTIDAILGKIAGLEFDAMRPPIAPELLAAIDRIDPSKWNTEIHDEPE